MRYKEHEIQFISDRHEGDGGLEAYLFSGVGYQCYAPQEAFSTEAQLALQKDKISADIRKLVKDEAKTLLLLGDVVLTRWVLLTPEFDSKRLVEYARMKSKKVREAVPRPKWCSEGFEIVVATDNEFASEKARLTGAILEGINLQMPSISNDSAFASIEVGSAKQLTEKLRVEIQLANDEEELRAYRGELLGYWVRGLAQLDELSNQYPTIADAVNRRFEISYKSLRIKTAAMNADGLVMLPALADQLTAELRETVPVLGANLSEELAWCKIASWFIECPLKFKVA